MDSDTTLGKHISKAFLCALLKTSDVRYDSPWGILGWQWHSWGAGYWGYPEWMVSFQHLPIWAPKVQHWVHNTILFLEGFINLMFSENTVTGTVSFSVTQGSHIQVSLE